MKKKKNLFTVGTLALGTMVVATPISSIANDGVVNLGENDIEEDPLFGEDVPTVYDVPNNPDFVVNKSVNGSKLTLTWDEVENADRYFVSKFYQIDNQYVSEGEPQYVTEGKFEDNIDLSENYIYRIAPEVDGELQLDFVAVVTVSSNVEVPDEETNNEELPNDENDNKEEPTEEESDVNEEKPSDEDENEEEPKEEEEQSKADEEPLDDNKDDEQPKEEALELTVAQLEQIDVLAKEYAENIVESDQVEKLYADLFKNLKNDSEFANDFRDFVYNDLTTHIENKVEELEKNLDGDIGKLITELENEVNQLVLDFFNDNDSFNKHFYDFLDGFEEIQPQLKPLEEDYVQLIAELVDESLFDEAKQQFDLLAEDYFFELAFSKSLDGLEFLESILDEEPPAEDKDEENDDEKQDPKDEDKQDKVDDKQQDSEDEIDDKKVPGKQDKDDNDNKQPNDDSDDRDELDKDTDDKDNVLSPGDNNNGPKGNNDYYSDGDLLDPTIPRTGDGSIQKVISPLVATMLALVVAFILVPNRKRTNA